MLVVGAGPAGLAAAIRLGQLAAADPETAAQLGEVPVAVLEKGKAPGLAPALGRGARSRGRCGGCSAATTSPRTARCRARPCYFLTRDRAVRMPAAADDVEQGQRRRLARRSSGARSPSGPRGSARWCCRRPRRCGCSSRTALSSACAPATRAAAATARSSPRFEPGSDMRARVTILAEGSAGHLTGAALGHFGLAGSSPQTWALGVKEVWKVPRPLRQVIHTLGWPLRPGARYREFGGSFVYPMGDEHREHRHGRRARLPRRGALGARPAPGAEDASARSGAILDGGERVEWGAKTIPEGGFVALPRQFHAPGLLLCGDGVGLVNVPALKGIHYAIESGRLAAEAAWGSLRGGALGAYDDALRSSFVWSDLRRVRNMRPSFSGGLWRGVAWSGAATVTRGRFPRGDRPTERDDVARALHDRPRRRVPGARRQAHVRQALVGVPLGEPDARRPAEPPPRADAGAARAGRAVGADVPGAGLRGRAGRGRPRRGAGRRRRTASSAARSRRRAAASPRPRAAPGPSTR